MTKKRSRLTCDNMEELVYLHEVWSQVREWETVKKMRSEWFFFEILNNKGKLESRDRDKIEFRLFNSSSIFNMTLREELFSLPKRNQTMNSYPGFMALVTWVKFLGEKLKATIPLNIASNVFSCLLFDSETPFEPHLFCVCWL